MNVEDRWTFDSNMLVYAADADSREKHETAKQLIWRARELDCVLTIQALCEFYSVVVRKLMLDRDQAMIFVREWISLFRVVGVNEQTMPRAMIVANEHQLSVLGLPAPERGARSRMHHSDFGRHAASQTHSRHEDRQSLRRRRPRLPRAVLQGMTALDGPAVAEIPQNHSVGRLTTKRELETEQISSRRSTSGERPDPHAD